MAIAIDPIKIEGLAEFSRSLRKLDAELPKGLRLAGNEAAQIVVDWAVARVPRKTGRAAQSIKARSTRTEARVVGYGAQVPYGPWLDFGGRVGRAKSVKRPFIKSGRFIYPGYSNNADQIHEVLVKALLRVAESADLAVTNG